MFVLSEPRGDFQRRKSQQKGVGLRLVANPHTFIKLQPFDFHHSVKALVTKMHF